ncbi:unnamed protein product [Brassica oleracea]
MVKVPKLGTYFENNKDIEKVIRFAFDGLSDTQKKYTSWVSKLYALR